MRHQRAEGLGRIAFGLSGNTTTLVELYQEGAAKIRLPRFANLAPAEAILINTSGGLTGGDRLRWDIAAGAGTRSVITTQACEKIYRSVDGNVATVVTRISVASGARLDWLPQETILFDHSALHRTLDVDLAADATFLAVEAVVFGRHAMGETIEHALFHDRWRIRRSGQLIFADDLRFDGAVSALLTHAAIAGGCGACAAILFAGPNAERHLRSLRSALPDLAATAFDGKLLARLIAGDAYSLRHMLVPALELLSIGNRLPKVWAL